MFDKIRFFITFNPVISRNFAQNKLEIILWEMLET